MQRKNLISKFLLLCLLITTQINAASENISSLKQFGFTQEITFEKPKTPRWIFYKEKFDKNADMFRRLYIPEKHEPTGDLGNTTQSILETYYPPSSYYSDIDSVLEDVYDSVKANNKNCDYYQPKIISQSAQFVIYRNDSVCKAKNGRRMNILLYAKIMQGNNAVYEINYFAVTQNVSSEQIKQGIRSIENAGLKSISS